MRASLDQEDISEYAKRGSIVELWWNNYMYLVDNYQNRPIVCVEIKGETRAPQEDKEIIKTAVSETLPKTLKKKSEL